MRTSDNEEVLNRCAETLRAAAGWIEEDSGDAAEGRGLPGRETVVHTRVGVNRLDIEGGILEVLRSLDVILEGRDVTFAQFRRARDLAEEAYFTLEAIERRLYSQRRRGLEMQLKALVGREAWDVYLEIDEAVSKEMSRRLASRFPGHTAGAGGTRGPHGYR
ncbi:MAG: hypothetical protein NUW23_05560 [Firmicutes bacterium]|nr:hypothetical protein [Bacillota bacterium]